jgi:CRISPR-associated protein Cmr5
MQTIQQQRAKFALKRVQEAANKLTEKEQKEYKSYASALPAMIHINGLGQAAAFYKSKGDTHKWLYDLLSEWLIKPNQPYAAYDDLIVGITEADMHHYRLAQAEAQALMDWVKKFAKATMAGD